jgi:uncharacterized membrane protein YgcG
MMYLIAGALLGAAVLILTLPWSRRDPADFSTVELGYAWRGRRGAVGGAMRDLINARVIGRSRLHGMVLTDKKLPHGVEPFVRAVYAGIGRSRGLSGFLSRTDVSKEMPRVAERVLGAGLRVGRVRRALGSLLALAAPVIALVELGKETGDATTGIVVGIVTVLGAVWLVALRGLTIRGTRTLAAVPRRRFAARRAATEPDPTRQGALKQLGGGLPAGWLFAGFGMVTSSFAVDSGYFGSDFGGGDGGGGGDFGGGDGGGGGDSSGF